MKASAAAARRVQRRGNERHPRHRLGLAFGKENTGVVYGWIGACHQLGAATAALSAGAIRTGTGTYDLAFWIAGGLCVLAGMSFLTLGRTTFKTPRVLQPAM